MRITVKVGTSTLAHATGRLNIQRMEALCKVLSDLKNAGHEIILVSSGAIGMGVGKLNLPGRPGSPSLPTPMPIAPEDTNMIWCPAFFRSLSTLHRCSMRRMFRRPVA